ncbi:MAG: cytochrome c3 family protein [Nitrospirota bacterium]
MKYNNKNKYLLVFCLIHVFLFLAYSFGNAKVTGICANCHTMHNSQNGTAMAVGGTGAGWNGSGQLIGTAQSTPIGTLLRSDCVGCHTSTSGQTIINIGSSSVPIVFNTGGYPAQPLAGGNFYWVSQGSAYDGYGHNVYGIAGADSLSQAPGRQSGTCGNATSCHVTLALAKDTGMTQSNNGCEGCHTKVAHHDDTKPWYRFLKGHLNTADYVTGIEDSNWEQTPDETHHNIYKGYAGPVGSALTLENTNSINSYCGGCHGIFHRQDYIGNSSPWLRHPTDILLPQTGEYSAYTTYSVEAPLAYTNPSSPTRATAVVMCLSCHRPHGSPYADILRWDYNGMQAGSGTSDTGCFTCHTTKNAN